MTVFGKFYRFLKLCLDNMCSLTFLGVVLPNYPTSLFVSGVCFL